MIKTIKLGPDSELTLSNNLAWAMIYKDQFGHDIVPDVMPVLSALTKLLSELYQTKTKDLGEMLKSIDSDVLNDALIELCGVQFVDFINLTWAMAKAYDDDIEDPKLWIRKFDEFPVDVIGPAVFELITRGLISSKNLESLRETPKAISQ